MLDEERAGVLAEIWALLCENRTMDDIRWKQRFNNYMKALQTLRRAVALSKQRPLSELEQQGLIQGFKFTHELGWNVLKDYLEAQGFIDIIGSRNATREAFKNNLIADGEAWMDMIKARNQTSHTYNPATASIIVKDILERFYPAFEAMAAGFEIVAHQLNSDT